MEVDLDEKYDVIIQGTGLVECLVAGAAARIGKSVLHLDPNSSYGGQWASFSLCGLQEWVAKQQQCSPHVEAIEEKYSLKSSPCEHTISLGPGATVYSNVALSWHGRDEVVSKDTSVSAETATSEPAESGAEPLTNCKPASQTRLTRKALLQDSRRFNVDLAPKILYSRGEMVELLISSNVARYVEFKCITRLLCWSGDRLMSVPSSRAQVFSSKAVNLLQKRLLMKFLQFAAVYTEQPDRWHDVRDKAFSEFLSGERITGELQQYVMEGMALCSPQATVEEGLRSLHLFLSSLGRYGTSPFLATLYGSGELPQAFCRLCAVFGGTYILERGISTVIIGTAPSVTDQKADSNSTHTDCKTTSSEPESTAKDALEEKDDSEPAEAHPNSENADSGSCKVIGVVSDERHFKCDHLVVEDRFMTAFSASAASTSSISRAVAIVDKDLLQAFAVPSESSATDDEAPETNTSGSSKRSGGVALVQLRSASGQPVTVLQFAPDTSTCAPRTWLLYLVCEGCNAEQDLAPVMQQLVDHYTRCAPAPASIAPSDKGDSSDAEGPSSNDHPGTGPADSSDAVASQAGGTCDITTDICDTAADALVLGDTEIAAASDPCSPEQNTAQESETASESPLIYSLYYNQVLHSGVVNPYSNLHFCSGPDGVLDYDVAIRQARNIFSNMYPGEEFMPRAPDPDEIIFDDPAPIEEEHCSEDSTITGEESTAEAQSPKESLAPQKDVEKALEKNTGDQNAGVTEESESQISTSRDDDES